MILLAIFNASSCCLLYFFNITPTVATAVYLKTLECLFRKNRSYKNCITEPYIGVPMSSSLICSNTQTQRWIWRCQTLQPQLREPIDFTYQILGFDYANGGYVQVYEEEGKDQNNFYKLPMLLQSVTYAAVQHTTWSWPCSQPCIPFRLRLCTKVWIYACEYLHQTK